MGTWRNYPPVIEALSEQGYLDESKSVLQSIQLEDALINFWLGQEVTAPEPAQIAKVGVTKDMLVEEMFPGFRGKLFPRAMDPDSEEYQLAIETYGVLASLIWNQKSSTDHKGAVQQRLSEKGILLCEARIQKHEPTRNERVRFTSRDGDVISQYWLDARSTKLTRLTAHLHDDLAMATGAIPELAGRFRREFGVHVDQAVLKLARVSDPTVIAVEGGSKPAELEAKSNTKK